EGEDVELLAEAGDEGQLIAAVHLAGGIVRGVDDDGARPRVERLAQLVAVEVPVRRDERHDYRGRPREDAIRAVVLVEGLEDDYLVTGIDEREDRRQHRLGYTAADRDLRFGV